MTSKYTTTGIEALDQLLGGDDESFGYPVGCLTEVSGARKDVDAFLAKASPRVIEGPATDLITSLRQDSGVVVWVSPASLGRGQYVCGVLPLILDKLGTSGKSLVISQYEEDSRATIVSYSAWIRLKVRPDYVKVVKNLMTFSQGRTLRDWATL